MTEQIVENFIFYNSFYEAIREFDDENVEVIYSEAFDYGGVGAAIMNRHRKTLPQEVLASCSRVKKNSL